MRAYRFIFACRPCNSKRHKTDLSNSHRKCLDDKYSMLAHPRTRLLGMIIDGSLSWSPHVDSICKNVDRKIGVYVVPIGSWPLWQEGNFSPQWFSQIWNLLLHQPSGSCPLVSKIDFWLSGERLFDVWQVFSLSWRFTAKKFKADSLNSSLVPTTGHHHPTLSPTVWSSVPPGES